MTPSSANIPVSAALPLVYFAKVRRRGLGMRFKVLLSLLFLCVVFQLSQAQDSSKPMYMASGTNKFINFPGIPKCATGAVLHGDPFKGAAILQLKVPAGCRIPWHWHTADEQLLMVSGRTRIGMKGGAPVTLSSGDYILMPAKGVHEFACLAACKLFLVTTGAFDIHYVDASGKEIPLDEAVKTHGKSGMSKTK